MRQRTLFQYLLEFTLRYPVAVEDDALGVRRLLLHRLPVPLVQSNVRRGHFFEGVDHLLPRDLHAAVRDILRRLGVHVPHEGRERWPPVSARWGVVDICT